MTPAEWTVLVAALAALIGAVAAVVSAVFAGVAVRAQHRAQTRHIAVSHATPLPVWTRMPGSFAGSTLGEPYFCINVHNDRLLPVVVTSAALEFEVGGGTAPFLGPPAELGGMGDFLPKSLEPGESATLFLDSLREIAKAHVEHGGVKWVTATLAGGQTFHGRRIKKSWLDGWARRSVQE